MVVSCCAFKCNEVYKKGGDITFHSFPKNPERRKVWEIELKRENFKATDATKICSKHFDANCFDTKKLGGTWLKSDAIPTIFYFNSTNGNKVRLKAPEKRILSMEDDLLEAPSAIPKQKRLCYLGDFDEADVTSPTKAQKFLQMSQTAITEHKQAARNLRKSEKRPNKKVGSSQGLLEDERKEHDLRCCVHSLEETSDCFDASFLEPEVVIKEEPINNNEDRTPSRLDHEFILPCTDLHQSCSTPTIKEVFTVVKTEPMEELQQITSNCRTNKFQTSEVTDVAKEINTYSKTTKPSSTAEKDNVRELTDNTPIDEDAATSKTNSSIDSCDGYGEYIASKELSPLMKRPTIETYYEESNNVSTPRAVSEQDIATPILSSAKKKNTKGIVNSYLVFANEVRRSIMAANPDRSFGYISRLIGARWRDLPLSCKTDYREQAHRQNKEAQSQLMSKGMPQSPAETSGCFDSSFFEPEIVIKEEPIDISEDPTPSRLDHEFILPCSDLYQSCSTPAIKEVFGEK